MNYSCKNGIKFQVTTVEKISDGEKLKVLIKLPMIMGWFERIHFLVIKKWDKMWFPMVHIGNYDGFACFETTIELKTSAIYHFCFSGEVNGTFRYFKKKSIIFDTDITLEECWKISINFKVPDWAKGKIMYHIFIDRYRRSKSSCAMMPMPRRIIHESWYERPILRPDSDGNWNIDFFGGDLKGIEETLRYIKKLGVTIIYISPIMRSQSNHRYDTGNYLEVDPYAGTFNGLKSLCDSAHKLGMYIILDAVFNHTGNDSVYFNEYDTYPTIGAYHGQESPYLDFYDYWYDNDNKIQFNYWFGYPTLPRCNGYSEKWREFILGKSRVIDYWFSFGIDGLRLDVPDELSDDFIEEIHEAVIRNKPDGMIYGEVWYNPMRKKNFYDGSDRKYISSGKGMHSVMNYWFMDSLIRYFKYSDAQGLDEKIREIIIEYPDDTIFSLMNSTSTHDISRAIEIFGFNGFKNDGSEEWCWDLDNDSADWVEKHYLNEEDYLYAREIYEAYVFTLAFFPGVLSIFYGDEVGLQGIGRLANRAPYPWKYRDKKLLKFFRTIGNVRKNNQFLENAELNMIEVSKQRIVFERIGEFDKAIIAISGINDEILWSIPKEYRNAEVLYTIKDNYFKAPGKKLVEKRKYQLNNCNAIYLSAYGGVALKIKK